MGALAVGRVKAVAFMFGALALLLTGTACGERTEPTGATVRIYPVTVQGAGERPTILRAAPHRIVPLGPGPRRILRALGLQKRIVSVNDDLVGLQLVGQIRRAHPDLIVASGDVDPLDLARASSATHAAVYVEPGDTLDGVERGINDIGLLTGRPVTARHLSAAIARTRTRIAARLSGYPDASVFIDLGSFGTVGSRTLLGDLVTEARGTDIAGPAPEQGPYPLRQLVKANPDMYLTTSTSGTTLAALRGNRLTRRLDAVRKGRFGIIKARLVVPGPSVGTALVDVAKLLHPAAFQ
jgi:ABC-type Fe3+-hydroxamate transport system substrate-binding protein